MSGISHFAAQIAGQPLLVDPRFLQQAVAGGEIPVSPSGPGTRKTGGTRVIQITGPIAPRGSLLLFMFGGTDVESLEREFDASMADAGVSEIALLIDSPGGAVTGVSALADKIRTARGRKPVTAYVEGDGASAAYWLASAASRIVAADTARLGSIGVVAVAIDDRGWQSKTGITFHQIVSSNAPAKRPDPLTDAGRSIIQREVDALSEVFVAKVASNRGVSENEVLTRFGQGALLVGTHAVAAGLADAVGTFGAVASAQSTTTGATKMEETHGLTFEGPKPTDDVQTVEAWAIEEWDRNPAVRQEFTSRETFVAYTKAAHAGRARVLGSRTVRR